jgi:hypothetical protein
MLKRMQFELLGGKPFVRDLAGNSISFDEFMRGNWSPPLVQKMLAAYREVFHEDWNG